MNSRDQQLTEVEPELSDKSLEQVSGGFFSGLLGGSGSGNGRANLNDISIMKVVDKVDPLLFDDVGVPAPSNPLTGTPIY